MCDVKELSPLAKVCAAYIHTICDGRSCKGMPECMWCASASTCDDYPETVEAAQNVLRFEEADQHLVDVLATQGNYFQEGNHKDAYNALRKALDATDDERAEYQIARRNRGIW